MTPLPIDNTLEGRMMLCDLAIYLEPAKLANGGAGGARAVLQRIQNVGVDPKSAYERVKQVHTAAGWAVPPYEEIAL
jgi:hypothetical protein